MGSATIGTAAILENSLCSVDVGTSEIDNSRVDFYLILPITFKPAFTGAQGIHMLVDDFSGRTSGWQQLGNHHINPSGQFPQRSA